MSNAFWLLTVPNEGRTPEQTFERLKRYTDEFSKGYSVVIPSLTVGTLDSLMALSDDMEKVDGSIEVAVRKIERQYAEIAGKAKAPLLIDAVPVERYLPSFVWEHAKYPHRRALPELVASLRSCVGAIEDELKHLAATYAEKTQKLSALHRGAAKGGKGASLQLSPLEEVLTPKHLEGKQFLDTEYLVTLVAAVPKAKEAQFLDTYATLCADAVVADGAACGPAVPGSAVALARDGDHVLYSVCVIKGRRAPGAFDGETWVPGRFVDFVAAYAAAAKALGFHVRPFARVRPSRNSSFRERPPVSRAGGRPFVARCLRDRRSRLDTRSQNSERHLSRDSRPSSGASRRRRRPRYDADKVARDDSERKALAAEVDRLHASILRWCKAHFAEAFVAWMHLKIIRAFVESVLRYGLPVDFVTALLLPLKFREPQLQSALDKMFSHLTKSDAHGLLDDDDKAGEYYPYVIQKCLSLIT